MAVTCKESTFSFLPVVSRESVENVYFRPADLFLITFGFDHKITHKYRSKY